MAHANIKTAKSNKSVSGFLNSIKDPQKKKDAKKILSIMKEVTNERPAMWGSSIVGFGTYHYTYPSGREGDWMITGFSPRAKNLTIYIMPGYSLPQYKTLLNRLGPHKLGKSCLYINHLDDTHLPTLKKLIKMGYQDMKKKYPAR